MRKNRGQMSLEYIVLIVIVLGAFVAMSVYIKRALQGRWKMAVDDLGEQYDPTKAKTTITYAVNSVARTELRTNPVTMPDGVTGIRTDRWDFSTSSETRQGDRTLNPY